MSLLDTIDVTYSTEVIGANDPSHYVLGGPGAAGLSITGVSLVDTNTYRLGLSGSLANGPITITISGVTDSNGIAVEGNVLYFIGDITNPTTTSNPPGGSSVNSLSQITITFSKPVLNAWDSGNYSISGPLTIDSVERINDSTAIVHIGGSVADGAITLEMSNIKDAANRPLNGTTILYTGDVTRPTLNAQPASGTVLSSLTSIDISFSENVDGAANLSNYSFTGSGAGTLAVTNAASANGSVYRLTLSGTPAQGGFLLVLGNIKDAAGNSPLVTSVPYTADITGPTAVPGRTAFSTMSSLPYLNITFSEPVSGADDASNYTIHGAGAGDLEVDSISPISGNQYRVNFTGQLSNGPFSISMHNITDLVGNDLANDMFQYMADTTGPQAMTLTPADGSVKVFINSSISVAFNENIDCSTVNGAALYGDHGLAGSIACSGSTATIVPSTVMLPGTIYTITATDAITDVYGNAMASCRTWSFSTAWTRQYGTTDDNRFYGSDTDIAGNVYCTGSTKGAMDGQTFNGGSDILLIKINSYGQKEWTRLYGGAYNDEGRGVVVDSTGHIYVCGIYSSSGSSYDAVLMKYDAQGTLLWQRIVPDTATARGITIDANDYIYITGEVDTTATCYYFAKYDTNGQQLLYYTHNGSYYIINATRIQVDLSGNIYVGGHNAATSGIYNDNGLEAFFRKFSPSASYIASAYLDTWENEYGNGLGIGPGGEIYFAGVTAAALPGNTWRGITDYFIGRYDSSLARQWLIQDGTSSHDEAYDCAVGADGSVYVLGISTGSLGGTNLGDSDGILVKYSPSGFRLWTRQFGSTSTDIFNGLRIGKDGYLYVTGYSYGSNDYNPSKGNFDCVIYKFDTNGNKY